MKVNFSKILEKYRLRRRYTHNFRNFKVNYIIFITEILQQIFQNFTNMLRKSEKWKKKFSCCILPHHRLPTHYSPLPITLSTTMVIWVLVSGKCCATSNCFPLYALPPPHHLLTLHFSLHSHFLTCYPMLRF